MRTTLLTTLMGASLLAVTLAQAATVSCPTIPIGAYGPGKQYPISSGGHQWTIYLNAYAIPMPVIWPFRLSSTSDYLYTVGNGAPACSSESRYWGVYLRGAGKFHCTEAAPSKPHDPSWQRCATNSFTSNAKP